MPEYVVSAPLEGSGWDNSTVPKGDVVTEVSKLKQELDGEIVVPASYQFECTLIDHDLGGELRLVVFPVVLGRYQNHCREATSARAHRDEQRPVR